MEQDTYSAAEAIDALLEKDDGALLAAMARYKSSIIELFGRDGIVEILRTAVDAAPHVDYFSRRSRREIDPNRPEVNLRVDHIKAAQENESISAKWKNPQAVTEEKDLLALKAAVIHEEVCRSMATTMNEALIPHWEKAKSFVSGMQKDAGVDQTQTLKLMLCTLFTVRISTDAAVPPADRLCTLLVFI